MVLIKSPQSFTTSTHSQHAHVTPSAGSNNAKGMAVTPSAGSNGAKGMAAKPFQPAMSSERVESIAQHPSRQGPGLAHAETVPNIVGRFMGPDMLDNSADVQTALSLPAPSSTTAATAAFTLSTQVLVLLSAGHCEQALSVVMQGTRHASL